MDTDYFFKSRASFIRMYYDAAVKPFAELRTAIEDKLPPFDNPPYSEDPEPPYLSEWMDTWTAEQVLGLSCVSLLSDSLKIYFSTLKTRVIRFSFDDEDKAYRNGFLAAFLEALGEILDTDWSDCPANMAVIEQIVLARNRGQHGGDITTFEVTHDAHILKKHPVPFFASSEDLQEWPPGAGSLASLIKPKIAVSRTQLFEAIEEVEKLVDYVEGRSHKIRDWHAAMRQRAGGQS